VLFRSKDVHGGDCLLKTFIRKLRRPPAQMVPSPTISLLQTLHEEHEPFCPEYLEVSRIIAHNLGTGQYFVLWENLDYNEATWEDPVDDDSAIDAFIKHERALDTVLAMPPPRRPSEFEFRPYGTRPADLPIPTYKDVRELRDYQVDGLNWLWRCWCERRSSILADEMGLGKTVQEVCMIAELYKLGFRGPFLVIAPVSTLMQWEREFHAWTDLNLIRFSGNKQARKVITEYELFWGDNRDVYKFEVCLRNYEKLLTKDMAEFVHQFKWEDLIVDEQNSPESGFEPEALHRNYHLHHASWAYPTTVLIRYRIFDGDKADDHRK
jgi:SNF2 family DNA or RNA helicase